MTTDLPTNDETAADRDEAIEPTRRRLLNLLAVLPAAAALPTTARAAVPAEAAAAPAGADAPPATSALRQLHRQWSAIEDELRLLWPQITERRLAALNADKDDPACRPVYVKGSPKGGRYQLGHLYTAEEIDAEIDERLAFARTKRQVAPLERERARLKRELEEVRAARREREEQLGIAALQRRSGALAGEAAAVLDAMQREPVSTVADLAAVFDVALYEVLTVPHDLVISSQFGAQFPWLARLMRHLQAHVPEIEFAAISRSMPSWRPDISYDRQFAWICAKSPEETGSATRRGVFPAGNSRG